MRLLVAVFLSCPMLLASVASGGQTFPYKTTVAADDVYVRSGPGPNYYPTDKLKRGQEIEVYRRDPSGWCAIRPLEGSFTWVSSRHLKPTEDNLAVVTEDGASAHVGSRLSDVGDVVQVRLQKGEVVELLEPPARVAGGDEDAWVKIAPPSGEFRWVAGADIDAADSRTPSSKPRPLSAEEFQAELDRIELELSVIVVESPAVWSFDSLRERTNVLLDQAQTAVERGRARVLANKIARFDDIKQRHDAVLAMRDQTDRPHGVLAGLQPKDADSAKPAAKFDIDGRFDGAGQLTQVVSPKVGAPRYALVDEKGDVRCYVTPAPGMNLHNYVGRQVGITGTRGYMPEQRASHIMARHITPLEGTTLR